MTNAEILQGILIDIQMSKEQCILSNINIWLHTKIVNLRFNAALKNLIEKLF